MIKHGGVYVVAAADLAMEPLLAMLLLVSFWIGRTLPIWMIPLLSHERANGAAVVTAIREQERVFRWLAGAGLLCAAYGYGVLALADISQVSAAWQSSDVQPRFGSEIQGPSSTRRLTW